MGDFATTPNLDTLPIELVQHILISFVDADVEKKTDAIASLRLVSRQLYQKSLWVFKDHHRLRFGRTRFELSFASLTMLLKICSLDHVRDQLQRITFTWPTFDERSYALKRRPFDEPPVFGAWTEQEYQDHLAKVMNLVYQHEWGLNYQRSDECFHLLVEIFTRLKDVGKLEQVYIECGDGVILAALHQAQFSPNLVVLSIWPLDMQSNFCWQGWSDHPQHTDLLTWIEFEDRCSSMPRHSTPGYGELLESSGLMSLIARSRGAKRLRIMGRGWYRLCELWNIFARGFCPQLSALELEEVSTDGTTLRVFLHLHSNTVDSLRFDSVSLRAGSWRKIFKTLRWAFLTRIRLRDLWQKPSDGEVLHGLQARAELWEPKGVVVISGDGIRAYLDECISHFTLHRYSRHKQVDLPLIEGISTLLS
ncbi:hypothetical protein K491DRAFT_325782 [Lophiostoma macrostomum CBS 122681]|uniref:F-box domain-containing protein n=1 Tax=Lophiostoma macrostomum CBS 122681 TaxID=1314788 RepID=A0A6A6SHE4_9PLEO|nr:hypothetical protein K491DRAFT_325782 [Lophiostoma macrostomum CBS 122681]